MLIKQKLRACVENFFNIIGVEAFFRTKSDKYDWVLFDKKTLTRYVNPNDSVALYQEGMIKTGMAFSDNFSKEIRFFGLQQMVKRVINKNLKGDFAECGCWWGHSTYIIAKLMQQHHVKSSLHVFDSFEGLSESTAKDSNLREKLTEQEALKERKYFASTLEKVEHNLKDFPFVKLYKGWIPDRFPEVSQQQFVFVHIDVDLYQPTKDALEFFYPRLVKSGCIVVDDYGGSRFHGCQVAVDEFLKKHEVEAFWEQPLCGCIIIK